MDLSWRPGQSKIHTCDVFYALFCVQQLLISYVQFTGMLCNSDNLTPTIFEYDQFTLDFVPSIKTDDLSRIYG